MSSVVQGVRFLLDRSVFIITELSSLQSEPQVGLPGTHLVYGDPQTNPWLMVIH